MRRLTCAGSAAVVAFCALAVSGCPSKGSGATSQAEFQAKVRAAYEAGDGDALERLIRLDDAPERVASMLRSMLRPEHPVAKENLVLTVKPAAPKHKAPHEIDGKTYVANVEVEGVLVIEVKEGAGGSSKLSLPFGKAADGSYYFSAPTPKS